MRRFFIFLLLIGTLAACGSDSATDTKKLLVAWAGEGDLFVWRSGEETQRIAEGNIVRVLISPDAEQIAFTRCIEMDCAEDSLWIIGVDGSDERQISVQPYLRQIAWGDANTLAYNTLELAAIGDFPRDDLTLVDVATGEQTALELGGKFEFSPDGTYLALIDPGSYQDQPGRIQVLPVLGEVEPVTLLDYPSVSSGAHSPFFPAIYWEDNATFRVTIPGADVIYHEFDGLAQPVALWRVSLDGTTEQLGNVDSSYFGLPMWSADMSAILYLQRSDADPGLFDLWLADGDGANAVLVVSQQVANDVPYPIWIGATNTFLYPQDNSYWIGAPGESPRRWWVGDDRLLTSTHQVAGASLVTIALRHDTIELRVADLNDSSGESQLITEGASGLFFDVIELNLIN